MKITVFAFIVIVLISCSRNNVSNESLSAADLAAITGMAKESDNLKAASSHLTAATHLSEIKHWDSVYHQADSLYWHHHSAYNVANHHPHNDHEHQWVPYDHRIDHTKHYHHNYPGHPHDSLIVVSNGHHLNQEVTHSDVHNVNDHHVADSLHHLHQNYHH